MDNTDQAVEPDQEYVACAPSRSMPGKRYIRIRVLFVGPIHDEDKVQVATVHHDQFGREWLDRRRLIRADQLHGDPNRRTGYRLVRNADGTPAGAVSGE